MCASQFAPPKRRHLQCRQCGGGQGQRTDRSFGEPLISLGRDFASFIYRMCHRGCPPVRRLLSSHKGDGHVGSNSRRAMVIWHCSGSGFSTGSEVVAVRERGGGESRHRGTWGCGAQYRWVRREGGGIRTWSVGWTCPGAGCRCRSSAVFELSSRSRWWCVRACEGQAWFRYPHANVTRRESQREKCGQKMVDGCSLGIWGSETSWEGFAWLRWCEGCVAGGLATNEGVVRTWLEDQITIGNSTSMVSAPKDG